MSPALITDSGSSTPPTKCFEVKKPVMKSKSAVSDSEFKKLLIVQPAEKPDQKSASLKTRDSRVDSPRPGGSAGSGDEGVQKVCSEGKSDLKTEPDCGRGTGGKTLDAVTSTPTTMQIEGEANKAEPEDVVQPGFASDGSTVKAFLDRPVAVSNGGPSTLTVFSVEDSVDAMEPDGGALDSAEAEAPLLSSSSSASSSLSEAGASFTQQDSGELEASGRDTREYSEQAEETCPLLADQESDSADSSLPLDSSPDREVDDSSMLQQSEEVSAPGDLATNTETRGPSGNLRFIVSILS